MSKEQALETLFKEWKSKYNYFVRDGFLGKSEEDIEILFVAKESNVSGDANSDSEEFWVKNQVENWNGIEFTLNPFEYRGTPDYSSSIEYTKEQRKDKAIATRFIKCMMRCYMLTFDKNEANVSQLHKCAFMNLNKLGGGKKTESKAFLERVESDACEIIREMTIINPKYIVFLGEKWGKRAVDKLNTHCGFENLKTRVKYYTYHPSTPRDIYSGEIK